MYVYNMFKNHIVCKYIYIYVCMNNLKKSNILAWEGSQVGLLNKNGGLTRDAFFPGRHTDSVSFFKQRQEREKERK